ncbi:AmmeMemoRadiSam system protein B [Thiolapillus sp.]
MSSVLLPSVAGAFYPEDPDTLASMVDEMLDDQPPLPQPVPKAIIAPHAGYIYSGPVAASAYRQLLLPNRIKRVVILAPAHRVPFHGLATTSADWLRTPLGDIRVDRKTIQQLIDTHQVEEFDGAFAGEHALEVQLPFLQRTLDDFTVVPLIVGQANAEKVSEVLEQVWDGEETLIVISSDLSHFLDYHQTRIRDQHTSMAIVDMQPEAIDFDDACGRIPVSGLLLSAKKHGLQGRNLDLRNSGDTAGDKSRVVGYGAYVFH